jgi:phosphate transport system substrate-binding protein
MRRSFVRACGSVFAALALSVMITGTATATNDSSSSSSSSTKLKSATLNGSGSSLQLGFDQVVIGDFKKTQKAVTINYASKGSGTGRQELADQVTDFAGSDAPYAEADLSKIKGGPILYFPTVASPITVSYNLDLPNLQLSADTIAKIFQGQITKWDDEAIKTDNPKAKLPSTNITVVVRSDSSGTTQNFSAFLTKAAPSTWTLGSSSTITWPDSVQKGAQNTGVADLIQGTDGAIGYVDFSDAQALELNYAKIKNAGPHLRPDQRDGREGLPDHVADLHHRVPEPERRQQGQRLEGIPQLHLRCRTGNCPNRRLRTAVGQLAEAGQGAGEQDRASHDVTAPIR